MNWRIYWRIYWRSDVHTHTHTCDSRIQSLSLKLCIKVTIIDVTLLPSGGKDTTLYLNIHLTAKASESAELMGHWQSNADPPQAPLMSLRGWKRVHKSVSINMIWKAEEIKEAIYANNRHWTEVVAYDTSYHLLPGISTPTHTLPQVT